MIRKIALALIFLTSCSNIAYSEQARFIVGYFSSFESDTISEEYFENAKFSFANVKLQKMFPKWSTKKFAIVLPCKSKTGT